MASKDCSSEAKALTESVESSCAPSIENNQASTSGKPPLAENNQASESGELPLVMQSSNLPTEDGLDIRHDGGGNRTSGTDEDDNDTAADDANGNDQGTVDDDHDTASYDGRTTDEDDDQVIVADHVNGEDQGNVDEDHDTATDSEQVTLNDQVNGDYLGTIDDDHDTASYDGPTSDEEDQVTVADHANDDNQGVVDYDDVGENHDEGEPPKKKLKFDSTHKANCDSENSIDGRSSEGSACPLSKESNIEQSTDLENDKVSISDVQINSNSGLMEFDILDEFESNDNDNDNEEGYLSDSTDISLGELDAMLEESLQSVKRPSEVLPQHEEKEKVILKVRGRDHFDLLPEGWIEVTHNSGMPVYLHKATRVCSVSKPYFLGPGSTRKHEIPVSAIPCLHYLKELEKEKKEKEQQEEATEQGSDNLPSAKLESVKDTKETSSLSYLDVREYCSKRFEFQTITVKRFKTWCGRRMHQKQLRQKQRPTLPDSTKLITCPLPAVTDKNSTSSNVTKREFIMNPSGKSPVCILHEYVQHTLRVQPRYIFKELENASTPYGAVVMIGDIQYGSGYGSSKKQAKSEAAKSALDVLIPKMKIFAPEGQVEDQQDVAFFDEVRVEDPRVCELSVKAGQPYPYQILLECLKRNYGMGDTEIYFSMRNLKHQKNEFLMKVGKHSVSVVCKNKRDGKHRASQAILQLLHPHINSWGSLLRMYGKGSCKTLKEKKEEEQRITELQSQACANKPNMSILNKLKEEMLKYRAKMKMKKPIGKLIPEQMEFSTSDSNLKNVEL